MMFGDLAVEMRGMQRLREAFPEVPDKTLAALLQLDLGVGELDSSSQLPPDWSPELSPDSWSEFADESSLGQGDSENLNRDEADALRIAEENRRNPYPPKGMNLPFLYCQQVVVKDAVGEEGNHPPVELNEVAVFDGEVKSERVTDDPSHAQVPLAQWSQLWPRVHDLFRHQKTTRRLNVKKIIDKSTKCEPLDVMPWKAKPSWPNELVIVADFSRHLSPYFDDYLLLTRNLMKWFKARLKVIVCTDAERQTYFYDGKTRDGFPSINSKVGVLYLGDLGFLNQQTQCTAQWRAVGAYLKRREANVEALLTVDPRDWLTGLGGYFLLNAWEPNPISPSYPSGGLALDPNSAEQATQLLRYLSLAFELTPGMIRDARKQLGMGVSVESLVIQKSELKGNATHFQWREADTQNTFINELLEDSALAKSAWGLIEGYESRLPAELQIEQRQKAGKSFNTDQYTFLKSLLASINQASLSDPALEMLYGWVDRMQARSGNEPWNANTVALYGLCARAKSLSDPSRVPVGLDSTTIPHWVVGESAPRRVKVLQYHDRLVFADQGEGGPMLSDSPAVDSQGFEIDYITVDQQSELLIERKQKGRSVLEKHKVLTVNEDEKPHQETGDLNQIVLPNGLTSFTINTRQETRTYEVCRCPDWADAVGRDRYGMFAVVGVSDVRFVVRWIPPGEFMMGSQESEAERYEDESPRHPVRFEQGFWLAETACTQNLWQTIMNTNPSRFTDSDELPVENVKKTEVENFILALNKRLPGFEARLPSESEWEYGCRAGTQSAFWFGDELTTNDANYDGNGRYNGGKKGTYRKTTLPVKSFKANPWGLYQMHGNVWEYCEDKWDDNYDDAPRDGSAWGRGDNDRSVLRGGSWDDFDGLLRSAYRGDSHFGFIRGGVGFRLARAPESSSPETRGAD